MSEIKLGVYAKDKVSGFQGFITSRYMSYSGMIQYGLQPHNNEGDKILDPMSFDINHLEFIDKGVSDTVPGIRPSPFKIGETVRDKVTGFEGIIISEMFYLNGCFHYQVTQKINFFRKLIGFSSLSKTFEYQRLSLIEAKDTRDEPTILAAATTAATATTAAASTTEPPGGPSRRVPSQRSSD